LNEQLVSLLVDLAHQPSFYLDLPVPSTLDYQKMQIHCLLVVRSCKHAEIFNCYWRDKLKSNYRSITFGAGFCCFFSRFLNTVGFFGYLPGCLNPEAKLISVPAPVLRCGLLSSFISFCSSLPPPNEGVMFLPLSRLLSVLYVKPISQLRFDYDTTIP